MVGLAGSCSLQGPEPTSGGGLERAGPELGWREETRLGSGWGEMGVRNAGTAGLAPKDASLSPGSRRLRSWWCRSAAPPTPAPSTLQLWLPDLSAPPPRSSPDLERLGAFRLNPGGGVVVEGGRGPPAGGSRPAIIFPPRLAPSRLQRPLPSSACSCRSNAALILFRRGEFGGLCIRPALSAAPPAFPGALRRGGGGPCLRGTLRPS